MISKADREQFALLAFHVFFHHSTKPIVAVTSALPGDGKCYVGAGLAKALAMSGRATALIQITSSNDTLTTNLQIYAVPSTFQCVRLQDLSVTDARATRKALQELSTRFDVIVLVLDDTFATSMNLELLAASTCTVISIAAGRKAGYEDYRLRDFLNDLHKPIVGVVPTDRNAQRSKIATLTESPLQEAPHSHVPVINGEVTGSYINTRTGT